MSDRDAAAARLCPKLEALADADLHLYISRGRFPLDVSYARWRSDRAKIGPPTPAFHIDVTARVLDLGISDTTLNRCDPPHQWSGGVRLWLEPDAVFDGYTCWRFFAHMTFFGADIDRLPQFRALAEEAGDGFGHEDPAWAWYMYLFSRALERRALGQSAIDKYRPWHHPSASEPWRVESGVLRRVFRESAKAIGCSAAAVKSAGRIRRAIPATGGNKLTDDDKAVAAFSRWMQDGVKFTWVGFAAMVEIRRQAFYEDAIPQRRFPHFWKLTQAYGVEPPRGSKGKDDRTVEAWDDVGRDEN